MPHTTAACRARTCNVLRYTVSAFRYLQRSRISKIDRAGPKPAVLEIKPDRSPAISEALWCVDNRDEPVATSDAARPSGRSEAKCRLACSMYRLSSTNWMSSRSKDASGPTYRETRQAAELALPPSSRELPAILHRDRPPGRESQGWASSNGLMARWQCGQSTDDSS